MATGSEIKEEYKSSLADLTFNSKPLISVLTILADENRAHAKDIVEAIEEHLAKVRTEVKLPCLYLIDCIIKNVGGSYTVLFCQNIVSTFCSVFEQVDEKTRSEMFRLRQTWNDVLPPKKLYALDVQINLLDPAWPVTASPPSNSIHFNPKFLKNTTGTTSSKDSAKTAKPLSSSLIASNTSNLDPSTLDMHQQLINKQRELLELQQKKLELELLQTQVKLQEQLKHQPTTTSNSMSTVAKTSTPHVSNLLLKPEVAKQLTGKTGLTSGLKAKNSANVMASVMNQRLQNISSSAGGGLRITPVNNALVNARPIRDPRILKHQQQVQSNTTISNVLVESKPKSISTPNTHSTDNKVVNNKLSVRDSHAESRTITSNNKDAVHSQNKIKSLSQPKINSKLESSSRKSSKSARSSKSSGSTSDLSDMKSDSTKSSTSSLGSPVKSKSDKSESARSPVKSPNKHKKKEKDSLASLRSDKKCGEKHNKSPKIDKTRKGDTSPTVFKDLKGSTKNRNYIRRNRNISASPELHMDVDLRMGGSIEKQPPSQIEAGDDQSEIVDVSNQSMDVDLRQLPASVASKKRLSTEAIETSSSKKTKSEMFDILFGNEDIDLRQLPPVLTSPKAVERPPTPPAPIISSKSEESKEKKETEKKETPKISHLDTLRAKLANATNKDKMTKNRFNLLAKKADDKSMLSEDTDMRSSTKKDDRLNQIIISPADEECIKAGNMTKAQEAALMNKIIAQIETQKLREAQRKESENKTNISLQPISDDELEADYSAAESDEENSKKTFVDKDDRVVQPSTNVLQPDSYAKYPRNVEMRDPRRGGPGWRGRRKQWENSGILASRPGIRTAPDPWIRPINPWRPMGPNFNKGDSDGTHLEQGGASDNPPGLVVDYGNQDGLTTINIDGIPRQIRFYDEIGIAFMNWDDPHEISFQSGSRRVLFDDEIYTLGLNEPYREVSINGTYHQVRLGAPTREIYIDGKWYECYFGGPGIGVEIDNRIVVVKLDAPPPQVRIGNTKRTDLVAGKINLIIDAKCMVPVFLDAKTQKFEIDGQSNTLRFADSLRTVLINDVPFKVEFGGLPKPITVGEKKHFIRFSVLPKGIRPGYVHIKDMEGVENSPKNDNEDSRENHTFDHYDSNEPVLPILKKKRLGTDSPPDRNSNSPHFFQNILQQQNLDMLSNVMASSVTPTTKSGYQIENGLSGNEMNAVGQISNQAALVTPANQMPLLPSTVNINELFQKLVASGMVKTTESSSHNHHRFSGKKKDVEDNQEITPVYFAKLQTLKLRQAPIIKSLYNGMQCSSCGMRFPREQTVYYSQHLDWHFRQNRKGKKSMRKTASRRWYYTLSDWKNYEEIEDLEERAKSYFENQQQAQEAGNDDTDEEIEIPSVPTDVNELNACCEVCRDKFEQFYNEEKEEWHLKMAIRVDGKTYHPLCFEDYQTSLEDATLDDSSVHEEQEKPVGIPGLENNFDDNSKDAEPEVVIDDDSLTSELEEKTKSITVEEPVVEKLVENGEDHDDDDDDDVIINEIIPEKIILDDDGDDKSDCGSEGLIPGVTVKLEPVDDGFMDIENSLIKLKSDGEVKIKTEPIDPDEVILNEERLTSPADIADTTHAELVSSMDGNVQLDSGVPVTSGLGGKIKINITKPLPVLPPKENKDVNCETQINMDTIDPNQPLPPGEEPVQLKRKPALENIELKRLPTVKKGSELTGLCSIM